MSEQQSKSNQPETLVTKEEWAEWKEIPTTKTFLAFLRKEVADIKDLWVNGNFTGPEGSQTLQLNSRAIGCAKTYQYILDLTADDINEGMSDE